MASSKHHLPLPTPSRDLPHGYPRITQSSLIRDFGPGCMDNERCGAPHNELLTRTLRARSGEMPSAPLTWWEARAPPEEIANALHPSLIELFKRAWDGKTWVFRNEEMFSLHDEAESFLKLYESSHSRLGDDEGLLFDQKGMKASFILDTTSITSYEWSWMALGAILDSYFQMIDEGKAEAVSKDQVTLLEIDPKVGVVEPWVTHQYTKTDLERATTAFKCLIEAIDLLSWTCHGMIPEYNDDILPPSSFAYVLTVISNCKVSFRYIVPGIRFPTIRDFKDQPIIDFGTSPRRRLGQFPGNCPLRIFQIDTEQLVAPDWRLGLRNIAPGYYIHPVVERRPLFWSNGFWLLLPFVKWRAVGDKRLFRCGPEPRDDQGNLYQAGMTNGITNFHLVLTDQVLSNWAERVEEGDWKADGDGLKGRIEKFNEPDTKV
ncbi:hypothetical protein BDW68DRAFT_191856 [Aspergillus falconensis]